MTSESLPTVYGLRASGNCYKLQLLLDMIGRPYRWIETDSTRGETRTPEFLALKREILERIRKTSGMKTDLEQLQRLSGLTPETV